ncbi:hypothetical protein ACFVJS_01615, partial [Nocardioides sp. NPDC057772]
MSATHASSLPARVAVTDEAAELLRRLVGPRPAPARARRSDWWSWPGADRRRGPGAGGVGPRSGS